MADKNTPFVKVVLDKERNLKLDLNALEEFEKVSGKSLSDLGDGVDTVTMKYLIWATLLHEDPDLTPHDVGAMIHIGNLSRVQAALEELMTKNV